MYVVHAADLHLDAPLRGLERFPGAPVEEIRMASRRALGRLVDLCIEKESPLLLLAGDVFDGDWRDFNTGLFFVREMARLQKAGTRVVMIKGNHDAATVLTRDLRLPDNVRLLSHETPETVLFDDLGIAVHGQSYADRTVTENLAAGYPAPQSNLLNIGLLHTNAIASPAHASYAPCTVDDLVAHGYEYWALGHVHTRSILHERPWVVYPGAVQGRHAREPGPHGCVLVQLQDGTIETVEPVDLDVLRWADVQVNASGTDGTEALYEEIQEALRDEREAAGDRTVAARITITGRSTLHGTLSRDPESFRAQVRSLAVEIGRCWPERIRLRTEPVREAHSELDVIQNLIREELDNLRMDDDEAMAPYLESIQSLGKRVAPHLDVRPDSTEYLLPLLDDVAGLIAGKLGTGEDT